MRPRLADIIHANRNRSWDRVGDRNDRVDNPIIGRPRRGWIDDLWRVNDPAVMHLRRAMDRDRAIIDDMIVLNNRGL